MDIPRRRFAFRNIFCAETKCFLPGENRPEKSLRSFPAFLGLRTELLGALPQTPPPFEKGLSENFMFEMPYEISFSRISMKENMQKRGDLL